MKQDASHKPQDESHKPPDASYNNTKQIGEPAFF
jgi:hypothetical protein